METIGVFLREREVAGALGIGRSTLWDWVKHGILPQPVRFGRRTTRWAASEIEAWKAARIEERDGPAPKPKPGRKNRGFGCDQDQCAA